MIHIYNIVTSTGDIEIDGRRAPLVDRNWRAWDAVSTALEQVQQVATESSRVVTALTPIVEGLYVATLDAAKKHLGREDVVSIGLAF